MGSDTMGSRTERAGHGRYEYQRARARGARVRVRFHAFIVRYVFIAAASGPGYGHTRISLDVCAAEASPAAATMVSRMHEPYYPNCPGPIKAY